LASRKWRGTRKKRDGLIKQQTCSEVNMGEGNKIKEEYCVYRAICLGEQKRRDKK
jgi:hypothetical protein